MLHITSNVYRRLHCINNDSIGAGSIQHTTLDPGDKVSREILKRQSLEAGVSQAYPGNLKT